MVNPVAMNKDQRKTSASSHDVCHRFLPESGCASGFLPAPRASARTGWNSFFSGCVPTQFPLHPTTGPIEKGGGGQELSPRPGRGGSTGCGARQHPTEIDRGSASQVLGSRSFPRRSPEQQDTRGEQRTRQRESRLQRWVDHPENLVGSQHHPSRRKTPDPVNRQHRPRTPGPHVVRNVTCHVGSSSSSSISMSKGYISQTTDESVSRCRGIVRKPLAAWLMG